MRTALAVLVPAVCGGMNGAGAAERPRPQAQGETRLPCPKQGAGFVRVPGSPTCIRLSGRAVGGIAIGGHGAAPVTAGQLSIDTRSESELGPVRAFVRMGHGRP
ncbi:hypothetical protein ASF49_20380 [Methylobacterium sp. Leaf104]|nr:hypothetical protein ASF49_20380 [Methylobacterium sp. Leaf104]